MPLRHAGRAPWRCTGRVDGIRPWPLIERHCMAQPKFRYVRPPRLDVEKPPPTVASQTVLAIKLGAVLAIIVAAGLIYARTYAGVTVAKPVAEAFVLAALLLPAALVLGLAGLRHLRRRKAAAAAADEPRIKAVDDRPPRRFGEP